MGIRLFGGVCIFWDHLVVSVDRKAGCSALQVAAVRQIIVGVVLCTSLWFVLKDKLVLPPGEIPFAGLSQFYLQQCPKHLGVKFIPGGLVSIVGAAYPLWLVVLYTWFFDKRFQWPSGSAWMSFLPWCWYFIRLCRSRRKGQFCVGIFTIRV